MYSSLHAESIQRSLRFAGLETRSGSKANVNAGRVQLFASYSTVLKVQTRKQGRARRAAIFAFELSLKIRGTQLKSEWNDLFSKQVHEMRYKETEWALNEHEWSAMDNLFTQKAKWYKSILRPPFANRE